MTAVSDKAALPDSDILMNGNGSSFSVALMAELMSSMKNWYGADNWEPVVYGRHKSTLKSRLIARLNTLMPGEIAIVPRNIGVETQRLMSFQPSLAQYSYLYDLLADDSSRETLVKLAAFKILGHTKVKLPTNTREYWSARESVRSLINRRDSIKIKFKDWVLEHFELEKIGYPIRLFQLPVGIVTNFVIKQYEYRKRTPPIKADDGDYVIDGGACWGEVALDFAHSVGPRGRVFSFEFVDDNLEVFRRNMDMNPELSARVTLVQKAIWEKSGEEITYTTDGPATSLDSGGSLRVQTITIDDFVKQERLPRVDFIKMDIERAELRALYGAERTLRTFKPKLAISLYHKESDFGDIPQYLRSLDIDYEFFLDHFTIFEGETILFAVPKVE